MSYLYQLERSLHPKTRYDATKMDIQRSIIQLENRLQKRKEVQRNYPWELLYQERLRQHESNLRKLAYSEQQQYKRFRMQDQAKKQYLYERQRQYAYLDHMKKIDLLKRQQELLAKQRQLDRSRQITILDNKIRRQFQADQLLLQKYQDGTKLRQYDQELKNYYGRAKNVNFLPETAENSNRHQQFNQSQNYRQIQYDDLEQNQITLKHTTNKTPMRKSALKKPQQKTVVTSFNTAQKTPRIPEIDKFKKDNQEENAFSNQLLQSKIPLITRHKIEKQIREQKNKHGKTSKKVDKSPYYKNKSVSRSPIKKADRSITVSRLIKGFQDKQQYNKYSDQISGDTRSMALAKIANRLKVSTILYKNPVFDDVKHQAQRIMSTFQNEKALRKEIKQKINNNPKILKKHKMVVQ